ncbi:hypothetical protein ATI61_10786 [Archangium gephyra]|uniref:Uncharacterized protein n=1 Tax=Archangium gephyra TaxID=48 RepID=A0AAC8TJ80_9BACT|nr:hypothetical protein [Archangium gephyra]AKJ07635.1 Hypothetical protein AA314_09261 [Archangium gephyra]REG29390.1 hypothetical protein ATI61_10786 [Archangium gephyra]
MADRKMNLGRERKLDFSTLENNGDASWQYPELELTGATRTAPPVPDEDTTGKLIAPLDEEPELRTAFSTRAVLIADLLRDTFSRRFFGRAPYRVLRVDEPEGPSTAGGLLARQSISLVAREGSAPSVVCGWVDTAKQEAQLRCYESVALRYASHHGMELDLSPEHYERFLETLVETLLSGGIKVRVLVLDEEGVALKQAQAVEGGGPVPGARGRRGWGSRMVVLTFVLGLVAGRLVPWSGVDSALVAVVRGAVAAWTDVSARVGAAR